MNQNLLQETTIKQYLTMLKTGSDPIKCNKISDWLNSQIEGIGGGMDLALFQMEKDLLLIQCKHMVAFLEFDEGAKKKYLLRIEQLKKEIKRKKAKKEVKETTPYKSFLDWLLVLKKYYSSDIDRSNDLEELVAATNQMMKYYSGQAAPQPTP